VARPGSRVRPLETPGNRRPREMIVAPSNRGEQNPAYRPSPTRFSTSSPLPRRLSESSRVNLFARAPARAVGASARRSHAREVISDRSRTAGGVPPVL